MPSARQPETDAQKIDALVAEVNALKADIAAIIAAAAVNLAAVAAVVPTSDGITAFYVSAG